jgi:hypothetical protein
LDEIERPVLATNLEEFSDVIFDFVFFRNPVTTKESFAEFAGKVKNLKELYPESKIIITQKIPAKAQCLASLIRGIYPQKSILIDKIEKLETEFFTSKSPISWNLEDFTESLPKTENEKINSVEKSISEKRKITQQDLDNWFNPNSSYAKFLSENLSKEEFDEFHALLQQSSTETIFDWQSIVGFVKIG